MNHIFLEVSTTSRKRRADKATALHPAKKPIPDGSPANKKAAKGTAEVAITRESLEELSIELDTHADYVDDPLEFTPLHRHFSELVLGTLSLFKARHNNVTICFFYLSGHNDNNAYYYYGHYFVCLFFFFIIIILSGGGLDGGCGFNGTGTGAAYH
jgi:hypothetical protein